MSQKSRASYQLKSFNSLISGKKKATQTNITINPSMSIIIGASIVGILRQILARRASIASARCRSPQSRCRFFKAECRKAASRVLNSREAFRAAIVSSPFMTRCRRPLIRSAARPGGMSIMIESRAAPNGCPVAAERLSCRNTPGTQYLGQCSISR